MKIPNCDLVTFVGQFETLMTETGFRRTTEEDCTCYEWKKLTPHGIMLADVSVDYPVLNYAVFFICN